MLEVDLVVLDAADGERGSTLSARTSEYTWFAVARSISPSRCRISFRFATYPW
jgi:hypothetical protein